MGRVKHQQQYSNRRAQESPRRKIASVPFMVLRNITNPSSGKLRKVFEGGIHQQKRVRDPPKMKDVYQRAWTEWEWRSSLLWSWTWVCRWRAGMTLWQW